MLFGKALMAFLIVGVGATTAVWTRGLVNYIHGVDIVYNWSKFTLLGSSVGAAVAAFILIAMSMPKHNKRP